MIEDFLSWVAEKSWLNGVCVCVSFWPFKHFGTWSTNGWADRVGGSAPFDAPERQKDDCANRGEIGATWHVARANPYRKKCRQDCRPNLWIRLKLCGPMDTTGGQNPFGYPVISGTSSTCHKGESFFIMGPSSL